MKKAILFLVCGMAVIAACQREPLPGGHSDEVELTGTNVSVSKLPSGIRKVFILNEGSMGSNNSSLDILRVSDGTYVTGAFKKMNPSVGAGLGDTGNDIAVNGDEVWITVNNSGIVEILSAQDETEIATVSVPTPRNIAFDGKYAYVTSWSGAYADYEYDSEGNSTLKDYKNPKGQLYRINLKTKKLAGHIEVGYQPEGVAVHNGKIYVANSGGISYQLPPDYTYDKTVSVIDAKSFEVTKTVDVEINLQEVFSDGDGLIYVTTYGDFYKTHSGLFAIDTRNGDSVQKVGDYASVAAISGDTVYCIGNQSDLDGWYAPKIMTAWSCTKGAKGRFTFPADAANAYGIAVLGPGVVLAGNAGDFFNPGTVSLYVNGSKEWSVTAGVSPGHFAIW